MEKIAASLLATAGIACAQTYNYDSSSETLVITGKGNTVADRITLEGPCLLYTSDAADEL